MTPTDFIIPVLKGAMVIFVFTIIGYGMYWILSKLGIFKLFKRNPKISDDIYEFVAEKISSGEKLNDIVQYTTKFPIRTQEKYINAYFELNEINKSKKELPQGKPYGESGLLFFYSTYSVLDFSFCRFDRDISFFVVLESVR